MAMFEHHSPAQSLVSWSEYLEKMAEPLFYRQEKKYLNMQLEFKPMAL